MINIYKITNKLNGQSYIGQTTNFKKRIQAHKNNFRHKKYDIKLYRAFEKYGLEQFSFEVLETVKREDADSREKNYIALYKTFEKGYNETDGGVVGYKLNEKTKRKVSKAIKEMWDSGQYDQRNTNIEKALEVAHRNASARVAKMWENEEIANSIKAKISQRHSRPITAYNEKKTIKFKTYNDAIDYLVEEGWTKASKSAITISKKNGVMRYNYYWKV